MCNGGFTLCRHYKYLIYVHVCVCVSVYYGTKPPPSAPDVGGRLFLKSLGGRLNTRRPGGFNRAKLRRRSADAPTAALKAPKGRKKAQPDLKELLEMQRADLPPPTAS